jgi:hypothetical protein
MMISRIALAAACFGIMPTMAMAQTADPVDAVLECRDIADIEARLACFDSTSARLAQARDGGELVTVTRADVEAIEGDSFGFNMPSLPRFSFPAFGRRGDRTPAPRTHDALAGVEPSATIETAPAADNVQMAEASPAATPAVRPDAEPAAPVSPAPIADPAPMSTPEPTPPATAGTEVEILERDRDGQVFKVTMRIERTRIVGYNTTIFYMENGQVWRQTDDRRVRMPRNMDNVTAEIRRGAMSSYLLRVNGQGRAIAVERQR